MPSPDDDRNKQLAERCARDVSALAITLTAFYCILVLLIAADVFSLSNAKFMAFSILVGLNTLGVVGIIIGIVARRR